MRTWSGNGMTDVKFQVTTLWYMNAEIRNLAAMPTISIQETELVMGAGDNPFAHV